MGAPTHRHVQFFCCHGQVAQPDAGGVVDGVGDGRGRRVDDQFADGFGAEGAVRFIAGDEFDVHLADVLTRRHAVLHEGVVLQVAARRVLDIFCQGHADGLDEAAFGLDFSQGWVDDGAAVDDSVVLDELDRPRFGIDIDRGRAGHVRRRARLGIARFRRFQGHVVHEHGLVAQIFQADGLTALKVRHSLAVEFQIVAVCDVQHFCRPRLHALNQALAGLDDGIAREVRRRRSVGAAVIRRRIRIDAVGDDVIDRAHQAFRCNLGKDRIAARTHVGSADIQGVETVVVDLDGHGRDVDIGNGRALHGRGQTDGADMAVGQNLTRAGIVPAGHFHDPCQTLVEGAAEGRFIEIGRHDLAFTDEVLQAQGDRAHLEGRCQFVDGRFQGVEALRRAVAAVGAGGNGIRIDAGIAEAESVGCVVKGQGFMP